MNLKEFNILALENAQQAKNFISLLIGHLKTANSD